MLFYEFILQISLSISFTSYICLICYNRHDIAFKIFTIKHLIIHHINNK